MIRSVLLAVAICLGAVVDANAAGTLRRGNAYEPGTIDPHKVHTVYENKLTLDMFEGLTAFTADGHAEPAVAESWTVSADGKMWTFKLRRGLKWSNGSEITADDVVFSFRRLLDPKTGAQLASSVYDILNALPVNTGKMPPEKLGVAAPDKYTIELSLENPAPYLPELLMHGHLSIVPRAVVEKHGDAWVQPENIVSNGAFLFKEWIPNSHIKLVRNPGYRQPATLDEVIYEPTEDYTAAVTRFRAGGLDMQFEFDGTKLANLRREMPAETKAVPAALTYFVTLNTRNPKLADARVRRALSMAIDRDVLAHKVLRGGQAPTATLIPPGFQDFTPPILDSLRGTMEERLVRAKGLMAEAGITPEKPLQLAFSFSNNSERKRIGVALAAMWKPLGVVLLLQGTEAKVYFANMRAGAFEVGFNGWNADFPDPINFVSTQLTSSISNYGRYNNPAYDELVARVAQTADRDTRHDLLRQAETMLLTDQPIIPVYTKANLELVSQRVRGWLPNPDAMHLSRYLSIAE